MCVRERRQGGEQVGEGGGEQLRARRKPATSSLKLSGRQPAVKLAAASPAGELSRPRDGREDEPSATGPRALFFFF